MAFIENTNINKIGGNAISVDKGDSDNGTQRVVLADNQPPIVIDSNSAMVTLLQQILEEQKITNKLLKKIYQ